MRRIGLLGGPSTRRMAGTARSASPRSTRSGSTKCGGWSRRAIRSRTARRHGAVRDPPRLGAARWRAARRSASSDDRGAAAARATPSTRSRTLRPPLSARALHLADGRGQSRAIRPVARLARRSRATVPIAVIARPGYDGAARAAPAMGWLRRFVRPAARRRTGRRGDCRHSCCCVFPPTRPPRPGCVRPIPHWQRRFRRRDPLNLGTALGHSSSISASRPRDRPRRGRGAARARARRRSTTIRRSRRSRSRSPASRRSPITW